MTTLLADHVASTPGRPAVVDASGTTTTSGLDLLVDATIAALVAAGMEVGSGRSVVALVGNQLEFVQLSLACMEAGWLLVPVNWHWVADEVAYVLDDADAAVVVVDERFADVGAAAVARSSVDPSAYCTGSGPRPGGLCSFDDAVAAARHGGGAGEGGDPVAGAAVRGGVMFYTSGTTGRPKGVRGALAGVGGDPAIWTLMAHSIRPVVELAEEDPVQAICGPMYHSAQWVVSTFALLCGATLVLQHRYDAAGLLELVERHRVTNLHLVPTQMSRLLALDGDVRAAADVSSLVSVLHGAAPCPPAVKSAMIDWLGPIVTEYYGGTEGGFISTISSDDWLRRPTSVGRPLPVVEVLVAAEDGSPAAPGVTGEIHFRSLLGSDFEYHNARDKTRAAHRDDGFATLGDVGHLDDEGFLHLSDRRIDMVVSGGVNIYPAEVEAVLVDGDVVVDAAVFGIPDEEMGEQVRAALVLAPGVVWDDATRDAIVARCRERLAGYKCPRSFEAHDSLPRSAAGKLLKRELRDPWWADRDRAI